MLKNISIIEHHSRKFHAELLKKSLPAPSLLKLIVFRISRTLISHTLDASYGDYNYFRNAGWFTSDYFYPVKLSLLKKAAGRLADMCSTR